MLFKNMNKLCGFLCQSLLLLLPAVDTTLEILQIAPAFAAEIIDLMISLLTFIGVKKLSKSRKVLYRQFVEFLSIKLASNKVAIGIADANSAKITLPEVLNCLNRLVLKSVSLLDVKHGIFSVHGNDDLHVQYRLVTDILCASSVKTIID